MKLLKILSIMLLAVIGPSSLPMSYFMAVVIFSTVSWGYLLQLVMSF